jgi:CheY-like chemotaxis protein
VLLDLALPEMDGLKVLRRIREHERTRRVPVVILTGFNARNDVAASPSTSSAHRPVAARRPIPCLEAQHDALIRLAAMRSSSRKRPGSSRGAPNSTSRCRNQAEPVISWS